MNMKRISAVLAASLMICTAFASCKDKKESKSEGAYVNKNASQENSTSANKTVDGETAVAVASGQAYLEIIDEKGVSRYLGTENENLCYNAVVADITGNGSYSVSVTANSNGYRKMTSGNADNYSVKPTGLMYASLKIKNGASACPSAVLTIDSIEVDGVQRPLTAKNYTFIENKTDIKSNIFNEYATMIHAGAVSAEGAVSDGAEGYSSVLLSKDVFASWTTVKVNFTVSGL